MDPEPPSWRLVARYTAGELSLAGDVDSLKSLGKVLQKPPRQPIVIELQQEDPGPYDSCLATLVVNITDGPVAISRDDMTMTIEGAREHVATLGHNLTWLAANEDPSDPLAHIHIEHVPVPSDAATYYVAPESIPLVVEFI